MGLFNDALDAITEQLRGTFGDEVDVKDHPGRFTDDELGKIILRKRKNIRVAVEDIPALTVEGTGVRAAQARFIAFVLCSDGRGEDRHRAALDLVEELAKTVIYNRWDRPEMFKATTPDSITAENLYSGEISSGKGLAWWSVSWTQDIKRTA